MNGGDVSYREHSRTSSTDEDFDSQKLNKEQVEMKMYGQLWPILLIVALVLIAMPNVSAAQEDDVIEANRALALKYVELRLAGWPEEEGLRLFAEDAVTHAWSYGELSGSEAFEGDRALMAANQPFSMENCQAWASEDYAALYCYISGTFSQDFAGLTANNAEWGINVVLFFRIEDDKIAEAWFCYNSLGWY
ncbi:MAG: ester cyclase, partial [Anaerolineae bacterium]